MSKFLIASMCLLIGLAGGGAGAYYWLNHADPHDNPTPTTREAHDEHEGHEGEAGAHAGEKDPDGCLGCLKISPEAIREYGIETAEAGGGTLETVLTLPGEIALNADRVAHIVPRVNGMVREVRKTLGDTVAAGEVLAVLESRELAEAKAADLSAEARLKLAESQFSRVEGLWKQKLSSEQQYQEVLQGLEEARIVHRETIAKLHSLGLTHDQVNSLPGQDDADFSRYELKAPFAATIVEKHAALGEVHNNATDLFVLADLSTVWVDVTVYPQDTTRVRVGSKLRVLTTGPDDTPITTEGTIHYISPLIRESTRSGLARAAIANPDGLWKPGLFVTAEIVTSSEKAAVLVPNDCIQNVAGRQVVFVAQDDEFKTLPVIAGRSNRASTEIRSGLQPGQRYVAKGAAILKAELSKGSGEGADACCP